MAGMIEVTDRDTLRYEPLPLPGGFDRAERPATPSLPVIEL